MPDLRDQAIRERDWAKQELGHVRKRQANLLRELKALRLQVDELRAEDPNTIADRKKELKGLRSNMARIKHNGMRAEAERDQERIEHQALRDSVADEIDRLRKTTDNRRDLAAGGAEPADYVMRGEGHLAASTADGLQALLDRSNRDETERDGGTRNEQVEKGGES